MIVDAIRCYLAQRKKRIFKNENRLHSEAVEATIVSQLVSDFTRCDHATFGVLDHRSYAFQSIIYRTQFR